MRAEDPLKLSVFVGSPKQDLEKARQAIIQAILEAGHIPDGMELWASDARPTLKTIADKLRLCDLHVIVLGHSYGQLLENEPISFTEWEYNQSRTANRPVISFLYSWQLIESHWKKNAPPEPERNALRKLWNELRKSSVSKIYNDPQLLINNIAKDVLNSVNQVIDRVQLRPLAGWVRAESKAARLAAALQGNPFLMRVMDRVEKFRTTGGRFEKERNAKKAAAEMFWDVMMNQLARTNYWNVFLESGSSLTYVSEALESRLARQQGWTISTNNALSLLQLLLFTDAEIRRNPPVAPDPEDPYGAIFTIKCKQAYEEPHVKPRALYPKEIEAIDEIVELLKSCGERQVILATASGWDTRHRVSEFHGPHVGSHANMLFKRAIFKVGAPVVLFLSQHKVDPVYHEAAFKCRTDSHKASEHEGRLMEEMRYCYPVFGEELPLARALADTPLALCIGYEGGMRGSLAELRAIGEGLKEVLRPDLSRPNFDFGYAAKEYVREDGTRFGAIMIANERFRQLFPR